MNKQQIESNPSELFLKTENGRYKWIEENTAVLVIHGIGNQLPLESMDQFGRGLIRSLKEKFGDTIKVSHQVVSKPDGNGGHWMDNVLRVKKQGSDHVLDLYEYYWAHYSEDKASWRDLNEWLEGVVKGARRFYKRNAALGKRYGDSSVFFRKGSGSFNGVVYWLFISIGAKIFTIIDALVRFLISSLDWISFHMLGTISKWLLKKYSQTFFRKLTNVLGDIVVYNVIDPKHRFYEIRKNILGGAVKAIKFLIERRDSGGALYYSSVVVGGHSLGSQVAYDAMNRINLLVNQGEIATYNADATCSVDSHRGITLAQQLKGFFTFGSPLDKIVFFLRENVPDSAYVRQQMVANFHGFKQRDFDLVSESTKASKYYVKVENTLKRHLDEIQWRNYFDNRDYVSGGLDYFHKVVNVDCKFGNGVFTHSHYWESPAFYDDFYYHFMVNVTRTVTQGEVEEKLRSMQAN